MSDLAQKVLTDNSKMTRIVDYLEAQGWAARQPDPEDRRAQRVHLTEAGVTLRDQVQVAQIDKLQECLGGLTVVEKEELLRLLAQLCQDLGVKREA